METEQKCYYSKDEVEKFLKRGGLSDWIKGDKAGITLSICGTKIVAYKTTDSHSEFFFEFPFEKGRDYNPILNFMHQASLIINKELKAHDMEKLCYKPVTGHLNENIEY